MIEYLITPLLPGRTRAEIVQFFNNKEHPFLVSSAVGDITCFMHDFQASTAVCSNQSFPLESKRTKAEPGIIKGPQRLVSGQDIGGQSRLCSGPNPVVIQGTSSLFRPVGGSVVGSRSSLLQREPRALNAVDILTETASEGPASIMRSPGIPNALDYVVKKEEEPQDTNPLFSLDSPSPQPTQSLFSRGTHAEALMEEDATEDPPRPQPTQSLFSRGTHAEALMEEDATERLVKEEVDDKQFDDTEEREEQDREKTKEAHQDASDLTINGLQDGCRFKCFVCNDVFSSHSLFLGHIPSHTKCKMPNRRSIGHSNTNQCDICGKRLVTKAGLMDHLRIHTGEKPFECEVCQKRFAAKTNLKSHFRTHTGQKPFECTTCHKKFAWKGNLTVHFRMHTGERPFECTECQMRFKHSRDLLRHRRIPHGFEKPSD